MKDEAINIVHKYKGEYYKNVKSDLENYGFYKIDYDLWQSPYTKRIYKFVLSGKGDESFITRIEELYDCEYHLINAELSDKNKALEDYGKRCREAKASIVTAEKIRDNLIESLLKVPTPFKFINFINKSKNTKEIKDFLDYIGKGEIELNDFLSICEPTTKYKRFCELSRKKTDGYIKILHSPSGTAYYATPIKRDYNGYINSAISRKKILSWYGEDFLVKLQED